MLTEIIELLHWSAMGSDALGFVIDDQTMYDPRRKVKTKAYRPFYAMKMLDSIYNRDRWTELSNVDNYVYAVQVSYRQAWLHNFGRTNISIGNLLRHTHTERDCMARSCSSARLLSSQWTTTFWRCLNKSKWRTAQTVVNALGISTLRSKT